jgi:hypothetical protein
METEKNRGSSFMRVQLIFNNRTRQVKEKIIAILPCIDTSGENRIERERTRK